MGIFFLLLGKPGAGKGTQARRLSRALGIPHISSGDLFREHQQEETDLGKLAQSYFARGELVPDDVTIRMVRERLGRKDVSGGAILDGFPRTIAQAEALEALMSELGEHLQAVFYIVVDDEILIGRLSGRLVCRQQGHTYHREFHPPQKPGICDLDGSELYQREDDTPQAVATRIRVYGNQTAPLVRYYKDKQLLIEVDGEQPVERVTEEILAALPQREGL